MCNYHLFKPLKGSKRIKVIQNRTNISSTETAENSQSKPRVCNIVPQSIINHIMDKVYKAIVR